MGREDRRSKKIFFLKGSSAASKSEGQAQQVLKKIVRLASVFLSPPFRSSDFAGLRRPRLYGFHTGTGSLANRKGRGRRSGGREREPRRAGEASPKPPPKPRSGLCPELLADFRIPKPPGRSQGRRGQFSVQSDNRFSGRGGGVGSLPRAWQASWGAIARQVLKKIVRLASVFPSPPFSVFRLRRAEVASAVWLPHSLPDTRSLSNRKGRRRRSGGREREHRRAGEGRLVWNRN